MMLSLSNLYQSHKMYMFCRIPSKHFEASAPIPWVDMVDQRLKRVALSLRHRTDGHWLLGALHDVNDTEFGVFDQCIVESSQ